MLGGIIGGILVVAVWKLYEYYKKNRSYDENAVCDMAEDTASAAASKSNKEIILESLRKLQCEPTIKEDGEGIVSISFEYQSETFNIRVDETVKFVLLCDSYWYSLEANDIEQLSSVKKIINNINWNSVVNVCYTKAEEDCKFHVHTVYSFLCSEEGNFTEYLKSVLQECFIVHRNFFWQLAESSAAKK